MKQDEKYLNHWIADDGKVIVKKELREDEEQIQTTSIWIGKFDSINNYTEIDAVAE